MKTLSITGYTKSLLSQGKIEYTLIEQIHGVGEELSIYINLWFYLNIFLFLLIFLIGILCFLIRLLIDIKKVERRTVKRKKRKK